MTAAELIAALSKLPADTEVCFAECEHHHLEISSVAFEVIAVSNQEQLVATLKSDGWTDDCDCDEDLCRPLEVFPAYCADCAADSWAFRTVENEIVCAKFHGTECCRHQWIATADDDGACYFRCECGSQREL